MPPVQAATEARGAKLIEAHDVAFRYRPEGRRSILRGLDLTIRHGERILLEGASGGGKSTLAALLTGLAQAGFRPAAAERPRPYTLGRAGTSWPPPRRSSTRTTSCPARWRSTC